MSERTPNIMLNAPSIVAGAAKARPPRSSGCTGGLLDGMVMTKMGGGERRVWRRLQRAAACWLLRMVMTKI